MTLSFVLSVSKKVRDHNNFGYSAGQLGELGLVQGRWASSGDHLPVAALNSVWKDKLCTNWRIFSSGQKLVSNGGTFGSGMVSDSTVGAFARLGVLGKCFVLTILSGRDSCVRCWAPTCHWAASCMLHLFGL